MFFIDIDNVSFVDNPENIVHLVEHDGHLVFKETSNTSQTECKYGHVTKYRAERMRKIIYD